tara:strand:- start:530 stop:742 length:213 start_codon:yes stop_codon:yes gene_type:complete
MTKKEINILRLLGYKDTDEDGAILEHPQVTFPDCYIWDDDKFDDVLSEHSEKIASYERLSISRAILTGWV